MNTSGFRSRRCNDNVGPVTRVVIEFDSGTLDEQAALIGAKELRSHRFGVKEYQDPDILVALHGVSPESRLLDLIDGSKLFESSKSMAIPGAGAKAELECFWEGSHLQLEQRLLSDMADRHNRESISRLLTFNSAMGTYLGRLARRNKNPRVQSRTVNGHTVWRIYREMPPEAQKC